MDFEEIVLLLEVADRTNPNLYPKLKPIHDAAMERLGDIAVDAAETSAKKETKVWKPEPVIVDDLSKGDTTERRR